MCEWLFVLFVGHVCRVAGVPAADVPAPAGDVPAPAADGLDVPILLRVRMAVVGHARSASVAAQRQPWPVAVAPQLLFLQ